MLRVPQENVSPSSKYSIRYGQPHVERSPSPTHSHEQTNGHGRPHIETNGHSHHSKLENGHCSPVTRSAAARMQAACV